MAYVFYKMPCVFFDMLFHPENALHFSAILRGKTSQKYFSKEKGRKIWLFEIILLLLHRISQKAAHG